MRFILSQISTRLLLQQCLQVWANSWIRAVRCVCVSEPALVRDSEQRYSNSIPSVVLSLLESSRQTSDSIKMECAYFDQHRTIVTVFGVRTLESAVWSSVQQRTASAKVV
ncbi:hypothetical protein B0H15DRAFT_286225 [Mycena belliarum]|uniref:Uncharacterized protein n=1 Tax=Mycena belliarum TaxID=1033014 RepID=A0AAD6U6F2_9AGAR|nr:hypothetical protein B0H15DRAFT_286225 [Mycena belliae]